MPKPTTPATIRLLGGRLCLDFANTVDWTEEAEPFAQEDTDVLTAPGRLVGWGERMGLVPGGVRADRDELARARELRDALHRIFATSGPAPRDLATLLRSHAEGVAQGELAGAGGGGAFGLTWSPSDARRIRWAVAADAVSLLADPDDLARVRLCPGHGCGWLFFDTTGRRRWCSMQTCGARAKMRRLYARQRGARG